MLAPNGKIYGIPKNGLDILVLDPAGQALSLEKLSISNEGVDLETITDYWMSGVLAANGSIYGIPYSGKHVLKIDFVNHIATLLEVSTTTTDLDDSSKWAGGVLAPDGKIYGIPFEVR